jgi:hypothetical protein
MRTPTPEIEPVAPISPYAASKAAAELPLAAYALGAWALVLAATPDLLRSDTYAGTITGALAAWTHAVAITAGALVVARRGGAAFVFAAPLAVLAPPDVPLLTKWSLLVAGAALVVELTALGLRRLPAVRSA